MSKTLHSRRSRRTLLNPTLFDALSAAQQDRLRGGGLARTFADGQTIQLRGDVGDGFWLIDSGQVRVGQFDATGEFNAVALLGPGDSHGELAMLANRPRVVDALAVGNVRATWIPPAPLESLIAEDGGAARQLIAALALQLQESVAMIALLRRSRGIWRIAQVLAVLARSEAMPCRIAITQQGLADLVGTSRVTVSSALEQLESLGLIRRSYGAIEIIDRTGLRRAARFDAA